MSYLEEIIAYKQSHSDAIPSDLNARLARAPKPRSLTPTTGGHSAVLIAECKRSSPSAGVIAPDYDPVRLATVYVDNGAAAVSVLTDEHFFGGSLQDLEAVRQAVPVPILRKDFTLSEADTRLARAYGADLILLITRILSDDQLATLLGCAQELGMEAIVEVHDEQDLARALQVGAQIVGINNRDLSTFKTDLRRSEELVSLIPRDVLVISESGISMPEHVARLQEAGVGAVLVGEALIRAGDTPALVRNLVMAGCPDCRAEAATMEASR